MSCLPTLVTALLFAHAPEDAFCIWRGVVVVALAMLRTPQHLSKSWERVGLSAVLEFPSLRKTLCALRSANPLQVGLAPEQVPSADPLSD